MARQESDGARDEGVELLTTLAVANYRSLRDLVLPLRRLTVVTGANGTGKSSLYRALRLPADASRNGAVAALAREGGLPSTLWAGPERPVRDGRRAQGTVRTTRVALRLGFSGDEFGYAVDFGLPTPSQSLFDLDPEIKRECLWAGPLPRPSALLVDRAAGLVQVRDDDGRWPEAHRPIRSTDSVFSELAEPVLLLMRERIRSWRFYDHFRVDAAAPARLRQVGTRTPVLGHDGVDLAAALQTITEIGDQALLDEAVANAFPGCRLAVANQDGWFDVLFHQHGLLRPLGAAELSDGTLRYLLLVAALLTPRPPELLVLNEPETSLHPDLLAPLASLVATAATRTQLVVVSHAEPLVRAMAATADELGVAVSRVELVKEGGATRIAGQQLLDTPAWHWPKR